MVEPDLRRIARAWPAFALASATLAYWPLLASAFPALTAHRFESWMFRPAPLPQLLVLAVAGWLLVRRRAALVAPPSNRHRAVAAAIAVCGAALFAWSLLTRSVDVTLLSLAANVLAFGAAAGGIAGARTLALPAAVLLLGIHIPAPLGAEIVWDLQRATAASAARILAAIGSGLVREGIVLRDADHTFEVIDGCSGLQGMAILTLVAILVGELWAVSGRRRALLVALALPLAFSLNAVRIAYVAMQPDPQAYAGASGDHTAQGIAVLAVGTALLYAIGRLLSASASPERERCAAPEATAAPWRGAAIGCALLALLTWVLPPFEINPADLPPPALRFAESRDVWSSQGLISDPYFLGAANGPRLNRRYQRGAQPGVVDTIDVLVAYDIPSAIDSSHFFSSKALWPGPDWNVERGKRARIWDLRLDADFAVAAHANGRDRAVIYTWRIRDEGLWRETWRALFALDASPWRRERARGVVQIVAYSPWSDDAVALDRARVRMDRFITIFRPDLEAL